MKIFFLILLALAVLITALCQPAQALAAAQNALNGWWIYVVPALLPFFILTELFSRTGLIRALSVWLAPIMRPLFQLPGAAALGLCLGFFAGSPTGGAIAGNLRRQGLVSRDEGERLAAFCNNAGPLYILLTVSAALQQPAVGVWLALAHYPMNLLWGLLLGLASRLHKKSRPAEPRLSARQLFRQGWQAAFGPGAPKQPLSQLLKESSMQSLATIGMIGAFMLIFSLLLLALRSLGLLNFLQLLLAPLCQLLGLNGAVLPALAEGCFEMTLGIDELADCAASMGDKLLAAAMILAWGGLSVHYQIAGVLADCDLTLRYYLPCRLLHLLAAPSLLLFCQNQGWLNLASSTLPAGLAWLPDWLWLPGALLAPGLLLLIALLLISFGLAGRRRR